MAEDTLGFGRAYRRTGKLSIGSLMPYFFAADNMTPMYSSATVPNRGCGMHHDSYLPD